MLFWRFNHNDLALYSSDYPMRKGARPFFTHPEEEEEEVERWVWSRIYFAAFFNSEF